MADKLGLAVGEHLSRLSMRGLRVSLQGTLHRAVWMFTQQGSCALRADIQRHREEKTQGLGWETDTTLFLLYFVGHSSYRVRANLGEGTGSLCLGGQNVSGLETIIIFPMYAL